MPSRKAPIPAGVLRLALAIRESERAGYAGLTYAGAAKLLGIEVKSVRRAAIRGEKLGWLRRMRVASGPGVKTVVQRGPSWPRGEL